MTSNRRTYVNLAEAIRDLNVDEDTKMAIASTAQNRLDGREDFSHDRFMVHALSDTPGDKWAYNRAVEAEQEQRDVINFDDPDLDEE